MVELASPLLGAEIVGVDLGDRVDEMTAESLREDFWLHRVLVFRNQQLRPDEHVAAVRIFNEPFDQPLWVPRAETNRLVYVLDLDKAGSASTWHVGGTWRNPPFTTESLTYQVVPEVGGHTPWTDLQAAYDGLSAPCQELLESVSAVYDAYPGDGTGKPAAGHRHRGTPAGLHAPAHRAQGPVPELVGDPSDRHRSLRSRGAAPVSAGACLLAELAPSDLVGRR